MRSKFKVKYTNISSVQLKGFVCRFLNHFYFYSRLKIYIYIALNVMLNAKVLANPGSQIFLSIFIHIIMMSISRDLFRVELLLF